MTPPVFLYCWAKARPRPSGNVPADDAMAADVADLGVEEVHRPALALGAAGHLAEQLGHGGARVHAQRQGVAVAAVAVDQASLPLWKIAAMPTAMASCPL